MVNALISIATFDVMPSGDIFDATIEPPEDEQEDSKFGELFDYNYMILNLGTMFLVLVVMLTLPLCLICTGPCRSCWPWLDRKHRATKTNLHGNVWIRFIMEGGLDIFLCAALNYIYLMHSAGGLQWENTFDIVNNVALIALAFVTLLFPGWAMWFYCKNFEKWGDEEFEEKYGAAYEGLRTDKRSALGYPMIFMLRRFALMVVVCAWFLGEHPCWI